MTASDSKKVIDSLYQIIKNNQCFVLDAGPGTGKTHTMVKLWEQVLKNKTQLGFPANAQLLCMTFTRAAAEEAHERMSKISDVEVAVLHQWLWSLVQYWQDLLWEIHKKKLQDEIAAIDNIAIQNATKGWEKLYARLSQDKRKKLDRYAKKEKIRELYNKYKLGNASNIEIYFREVKQIDCNLLKNKANFLRLLSKLLYRQRCVEAIEQIDNMTAPQIDYDIRSNRDDLPNMKISHDSVLSYACKAIEKRDELKWYIVQRYPLIFVDEYQDTATNVVNMLYQLKQWASQRQLCFNVGYFGDRCQSIYENGVGTKLCDIHKNLEKVSLNVNLRSPEKIVRIANNFRTDGVWQISPQSDCCYAVINSDSLKKKVINKLHERWNISQDNPLTCLELTNGIVAQESGFSKIYDFFKTSPYYKHGNNYQLLREHVLSRDEKELGDASRVLYRLLNVYDKVRCKGGTTNLLYEADARHIVSELSVSRNITLRTFAKKFFDAAQKTGVDVKEILSFDVSTYPKLLDFLQQTLCKNAEDSITLEFKKNLKDLFGLKISEEPYLWYKYVNRDYAGLSDIYYTLHSTKGLKFDNVAVFLTPDLGIKREIFYSMFKYLANNNTSASDKSATDSPDDFIFACNLLYVAITRAARNLCIVYITDHDNKAEADQLLDTVFADLAVKLTV